MFDTSTNSNAVSVDRTRDAPGASNPRRNMQLARVPAAQLDLVELLEDFAGVIPESDMPVDES